MPDIQYPARYLANARFLANYRISGILNQLDIQYLDSLNMRYPAEYWKWPDILPNPNYNINKTNKFKKMNKVQYYKLRISTKIVIMSYF